MYDAVADPNCYPGATVHKNFAGIRNQAALERFETISTAQRVDEPLPHAVSRSNECADNAFAGNKDWYRCILPFTALSFYCGIRSSTAVFPHPIATPG